MITGGCDGGSGSNSGDGGGGGGGDLIYYVFFRRYIALRKATSVANGIIALSSFLTSTSCFTSSTTS